MNNSEPKYYLHVQFNKYKHYQRGLFAFNHRNFLLFFTTKPNYFVVSFKLDVIDEAYLIEKRVREYLIDYNNSYRRKYVGYKEVSFDSFKFIVAEEL